MTEELDESKADAIFLDLPKPQDAIVHASKVLKRGGKLCSFSPCIEQIVATASTLAKNGYSDITTVECLEREYTRKSTKDKKIFENGTSSEGDISKTVFAVGNADDRTHTGFLLFATKYTS